MSSPEASAKSDRSPTLIWLAYLAAFAGVCSHASSEFVVKLTGLAGAEVSVWRFTLGGLALVLMALAQKSSRDLLTPLRVDPVPVSGLSIFGMTLGQFLFHWALNYATVVQVATLVTTSIVTQIVAITGFVLGEIFYEEIQAAVGRRRDKA